MRCEKWTIKESFEPRCDVGTVVLENTLTVLDRVYPNQPSKGDWSKALWKWNDAAETKYFAAPDVKS